MTQTLKFEQSIETIDHLQTHLQHDTALRLETQNRTLWSCFLMDKLLSCGKLRPVTFRTGDMDIPLPVPEEDYIFSDFSNPQCTIDQAFLVSDNSLVHGTLDCHFALILQGVDIWAEISRWVGQGGRRASHGPEDCPWKPQSSWGKISQRLEQWRTRQDQRVRYSPARLGAHLQRGNGDVFAFINVMYYLW